MERDNNESKRPRTILLACRRFGLRTLFCVVGLIGILFAVSSYYIRQVQQQQALVREVTRVGGKVTYDLSQWESLGELIGRRIGFDYLCHVKSITFDDCVFNDVSAIARYGGKNPVHLRIRNCRISDEQLAVLVSSMEIVGLDLSRPSVSDKSVVSLLGCKNLVDLSLGNTQVSDACFSDLAKLSSLQVLRFDNTNVTGAKIVELCDNTSLYRLDLAGCPIAVANLRQLECIPRLSCINLAHTAMSDREFDVIERLSNLRVLQLDGTHVTSARIATYKAAHPRILVSFDESTNGEIALDGRQKSQRAEGDSQLSD